jgi:hypothetical protein
MRKLILIRVIGGIREKKIIDKRVDAFIISFFIVIFRLKLLICINNMKYN